MEVVKLTPAEWRVFSHDAHKVAFAELNRPEGERIDFALLLGDGSLPRGYMTCRELDSDTVYWQFGGAFPGTKGTVHSFQAYQAFVAFARTHYKRVATYIENTNTAMLRMAMKVGFRIVGVRVFKGSVLLEHLLEFEASHAA